MPQSILADFYVKFSRFGGDYTVFDPRNRALVLPSTALPSFCHI